MQKLLFVILFMLISIIINYFLICRTNKKFFYIATITIILLNIIFYVLDKIVFKNELFDYFAFNILLSFILSITFEDININMIDTRVVFGYFVLFIIYRIIFLDFIIFVEGLLGFVLSLVIMLIAYFIKRNSIGIGDIEAIAACGMIIGFPNIFHFLFKAFLFVFIAGIFLTITKKKKLLSELPFAPFLLLAAIL